MNRTLVLALAGALAVLCACSGGGTGQPAAPARSHSVQELLLGGKPVATASGVTVAQGTTVTHSLQKGESIPDGTRIDVPANLVVVVVSTGGKSTVTLQPGSSLTFVSTGAGEVISRNAGDASFSVVPGALDFFRVQAGESLTASVHGTVFSVSGSGSDVTFTCTRGTVDIVKSGYMQVGTDSYPTTLTDVIDAHKTPKATYHPTHTWYLAKFSNFDQAEAFYRQQEAVAQRSGDPHAIETARLNLGSVHHTRLHAAILRIRRMPVAVRERFLRAHPRLRARIAAYHRHERSRELGRRRVVAYHPATHPMTRRFVVYCPPRRPRCSCPARHPHCVRRVR